MSDDLDARITEALPGIPGDAILHQRHNWQPTNIMRRILIAENERKIEEAHRSLETCAPDKFQELQGTIKGLRQAIATIDTVGVNPRQ